MKKIILTVILLILAGIVPEVVSANPFRTYWVCVPKIRPDATDLRFYIREKVSCTQDEYWARVIPKKDGTILLMPSDAPLSREDYEDLQNFMEYHGIQR